jgi:hypothetical protein
LPGLLISNSKAREVFLGARRQSGVKLYASHLARRTSQMAVGWDDGAYRASNDADVSSDDHGRKMTDNTFWRVTAHMDATMADITAGRYTQWNPVSQHDESVEVLY